MNRTEDLQIWRIVKSNGVLSNYKIQRGCWQHRQNNLSGKWRWKFVVEPGFEFTEPDKISALLTLNKCSEQWPADGGTTS